MTVLYKSRPLPEGWRREPNPYRDGKCEAVKRTKTDDGVEIVAELDPYDCPAGHRLAGGTWQAEVILGDRHADAHGSYRGDLRKGCEVADAAIARLREQVTRG